MSLRYNVIPSDWQFPLHTYVKVEHRSDISKSVRIKRVSLISQIIPSYMEQIYFYSLSRKGTWHSLETSSKFELIIVIIINYTHMASLTQETGLYKDVISGLTLSSTGLIFLVRSVNSIFSGKTMVRPEYIPDHVKYQSLGTNTFFLAY